jgi:hypothetical protein
VDIDGIGGILGQASPDANRPGSLLPYHGFMEFDRADLQEMEANGQLYEVVLHEIGHVLGFGVLWSALGLLEGAGTAGPRFTGPQAVAEYQALVGASVSSVPVENRGGAGTRDAHWQEAVLGSELMTGYVSPAGVANPISRLTIASLADLGYTVHLAAADSFSL